MNKKMHSTTKELTIKVPLAEVTIQHGEEPINEFMEEMIDVCMLGVCFDVHRALRLGYWDLEDDGGHLDSEIVDVAGLDVFGQQPIKKHQECVCPNCARTLAASRFAPHLEKCMGMGRNSSRIASRRLQTSGRIESNDYGDMEGELDIDWSFENDRKNKKLKRERDKTSSPKRNKMKKSEMIVGLSSLVNNGSSRPGTPCSTTSGELAAIKNGPTVQALETLSQEEKVALLTQTCGAISEHTGKMCTRTGRCVQHTDEQRRSVRDLLLGDTDDVPWPPSMRPEGSSLDQDEIHIDVDGYEDTDAGNLLRDLTPLSWEQESNISTGSESTVNIQNSPISKKKKKTKARKNRMR